MTETVNLGLPYIEAAQAQKHVTHNEALRILDALVMLTAKDRDLSAPPAEPQEGARYIVKPAGSGAFAGKDHRIAHYSDGGWTFYEPRAGWTCYVEDEGALLAWSGEEWTAALDILGGVSELQNLALLGIATEADGLNPFAAKINNALWTARSEAEGGDGTLRYKLSKESAEKTLSLLFQNAYSGRAEIGLTGDDDLHFKTSPDGEGWSDSLLLSSQDGAARVCGAFHLTGILTPAELESDIDDYDPPGLSAASVLRLNAETTRNLTGLSGGGEGRILTLMNSGTGAIVLRNSSASSSSANRFHFSSDVTLASRQSAMLRYDAVAERWTLLAGPQPSGGGGGAADLELVLAQLALGLSDALNVAQFLGASGNRFADSFDTAAWIDLSGSTHLDTGTAGLIKPQGADASAAISGGTGSPIGSMTGGGGLAAAFDSNTAQNFSTGCASPGVSSSGFNNTVGKDWGSENAKTITRFKVWAPSANGVLFSGGAQLRLQASNNNSDWTTLYDSGSAVLASGGSSIDVTSSIDTANAYRYHRINLNGNGSNSAAVSELEFFESTGIEDMTALSQPLTAAVAPATAKSVLRVNFVDEAEPGTDYFVDVSRDDGISWSTFTLHERFAVGLLHVLESDELDISGQPSGTSIRWRIRTLNEKMVETHDIYLYWT